MEEQLKQKNKIEISVKKQVQIEKELIGKIIPHKNHTLFEINNETVHGPMTNESTHELTNETFNRPWGHYTPIYEDGAHSNKVTRIVVLFNKKLSLQSRNKRSKHWIIIKGHAKIQIGNNYYNVGTSIHVYIPINTEHRIENIGGDVLEFIEIQIGESDDIRYKND